MKLGRKHRQLIAAFLVVFFGLLTANNVFFIHVQQLPDGTYIVHAHPFNKKANPPTEHNHSAKELLFFASNMLLSIFCLFAFFFGIKQVVIQQIDIPKQFHETTISGTTLGRAPPQPFLT